MDLFSQFLCSNFHDAHFAPLSNGQCDGLLIDVSAIIRIINGSTLRDNLISKEIRLYNIVTTVFEWVERLIEIIHPRSFVFLALDGVLPLQCEMCLRDEIVFQDKLDYCGAGSEIAEMIGDSICFHLVRCVSSVNNYSNLEFMFSGAYSPGISYRKLADFIRHDAQQHAGSTYAVFSDSVSCCLSCFTVDVGVYFLCRQRDDRTADCSGDNLFCFDLNHAKSNIAACSTVANNTEMIDSFVLVCALASAESLPLFAVGHNEANVFEYYWFMLHTFTQKFATPLVRRETIDLATLQNFLNYLQSVSSPSENCTLSTDANEKSTRNTYYRNCFELSQPSGTIIAKIVQRYVITIQWVMGYIYGRCPSWSWVYPYHYAPLLRDLCNMRSDVPIDFDADEPPSPYVHLMSILPAKFSQVLPAPLTELMTNKSSSIVDLFEALPCSTDVLMSLKPIDWPRIGAAVQSVEHLLSPDERRRNESQSMVAYRFSAKPSGPLPSPYPTVWTDLPDTFCQHVSLPFDEYWPPPVQFSSTMLLLSALCRRQNWPQPLFHVGNPGSKDQGMTCIVQIQDWYYVSDVCADWSKAKQSACKKAMAELGADEPLQPAATTTLSNSDCLSEPNPVVDDCALGVDNDCVVIDDNNEPQQSDVTASQTQGVEYLDKASELVDEGTEWVGESAPISLDDSPEVEVIADADSAERCSDDGPAEPPSCGAHSQPPAADQTLLDSRQQLLRDMFGPPRQPLLPDPIGPPVGHVRPMPQRGRIGAGHSFAPGGAALKSPPCKKQRVVGHAPRPGCSADGAQRTGASFEPQQPQHYAEYTALAAKLGLKTSVLHMEKAPPGMFQFKMVVGDRLTVRGAPGRTIRDAQELAYLAAVKALRAGHTLDDVADRAALADAPLPPRARSDEEQLQSQLQALQVIQRRRRFSDSQPPTEPLPSVPDAHLHLIDISDSASALEASPIKPGASCHDLVANMREIFSVRVDLNQPVDQQPIEIIDDDCGADMAQPEAAEQAQSMAPGPIALKPLTRRVAAAGAPPDRRRPPDVPSVAAPAAQPRSAPNPARPRITGVAGDLSAWLQRTATRHLPPHRAHFPSSAASSGHQPLPPAACSAPRFSQPRSGFVQHFTSSSAPKAGASNSGPGLLPTPSHRMPTRWAPGAYNGRQRESLDSSRELQAAPSAYSQPASFVSSRNQSEASLSGFSGHQPQRSRDNYAPDMEPVASAYAYDSYDSRLNGPEFYSRFHHASVSNERRMPRAARPFGDISADWATYSEADFGFEDAHVTHDAAASSRYEWTSAYGQPDEARTWSASGDWEAAEPVERWGRGSGAGGGRGSGGWRRAGGYGEGGRGGGGGYGRCGGWSGYGGRAGGFRGGSSGGRVAASHVRPRGRVAAAPAQRAYSGGGVDAPAASRDRDDDCWNFHIPAVHRS